MGIYIGVQMKIQYQKHSDNTKNFLCFNKISNFTHVFKKAKVISSVCLIGSKTYFLPKKKKLNFVIIFFQNG